MMANSKENISVQNSNLIPLILQTEIYDVEGLRSNRKYIIVCMFNILYMFKTGNKQARADSIRRLFKAGIQVSQTANQTKHPPPAVY